MGRRLQKTALPTVPGRRAASLAPAGAQLFASQAAAAASAFLLGLLIARSLGPTGLGSYAAAMALLIVQLTFTELGFSILLTREAARRPWRMNRMLLGTSGLKLGLFALSIPAVLLLRGPTTTELLIPGMIWVLLSAICLGPLSLLRGRGHFATHLYLQLAETALLLPAGLYLALRRAPVAAFLWLLAAAQAAKLAAAIAVHAGKLTSAGGSWMPRGAFLPWLLRAGARFGLAVLISVAYFRADILLLRRLAGAADTGRYAAALALFETGKLLPSAFLGALYPRLAAAGGSLAQVAAHGLKRALLLAFASAAVLFGAAPWLVRGIFGPRFQSGADLLLVLAPVVVPATLTSGFTLLLFASGREPAVSAATGAAIAVLVAGLAILVPPFAAEGAALSRAIAEIFLCLLLWSRVRPLLRG